MFNECPLKLKRQIGFSLVELMLAVTLGLFLLISIGKIYLSMKSAYYAQTNIARLQENGRLVTHILTNNIQMAGYAGCNASNLTSAIIGYNSSNVPSFLQGMVAPDTDVIVIKKADTAITYLTKDIAHTTNIIYVANNPAIESNKQLLISDCEESQLFTTINLAKQTIKTNSEIKRHYQKLDTEVARFTEIAYFVGQTTRTNAHGRPIYALYSITNAGNKQELIDGIENMQIKYVVNDKYYSAAQISNWGEVAAVYITLDLNFGAKTKPWTIYITLQERAVQS